MATGGKDRDYAFPEGHLRRRNPATQPRAIKGLENAKLMALEHEAFDVPPDKEIRKLKPGDWVKVARNNERFWVRLTGFVGRRWHGEVDNILVLNDDLELGDSIYFMKKNIYDILYDDPEKMSEYRKKMLEEAGIHPWGHRPQILPADVYLWD